MPVWSHQSRASRQTGKQKRAMKEGSEAVFLGFYFWDVSLGGDTPLDTFYFLLSLLVRGTQKKTTTNPGTKA
jgi:hypothetical protein